MSWSWYIQYEDKSVLFWKMDAPWSPRSWRWSSFKSWKIWQRGLLESWRRRRIPCWNGCNGWWKSTPFSKTFPKMSSRCWWYNLKCLTSVGIDAEEGCGEEKEESLSTSTQERAVVTPMPERSKIWAVIIEKLFRWTSRMGPSGHDQWTGLCRVVEHGNRRTDLHHSDVTQLPDQIKIEACEDFSGLDLPGPARSWEGGEWGIQGGSGHERRKNAGKTM